MVGFATPVWLGALAVLAIPIALHLWSRRPTRVVRVGSLRHLAGPEGPRAWGRRLDDVPLLLVRLVALAAPVLALAGLYWTRTGAAPTATATVFVVDPELLADSLALFSDPLVDSLRRARVPIRVLASGAPLLEEYDPAAEAALPASAWARLRELDAMLPGGPVVVIGAARAGTLGAGRPALARPIRWHELASDSTGPRVVESWPGAGDTVIRLMEERTGLSARRFLDAVAVPDKSLRAESGPPIPRRIAIVAPAENFETRAVRAAFGAATAGLFGRTPDITLSAGLDSGSNRPKLDWIVWLGSGSLPAAIGSAVRAGTHLLEFADRAQPIALESGLVSVGAAAIPPSLSAVQLFRRGPVISGAPALLDQHGNAALTLTREGEGRHYRLATRPDPLWSDLALGSALPELAVFLLRQAGNPGDDAPVGAAQATPLRLGAADPATSRTTSLRTAALWLAGGLLLAERLLAHRRRSPA